MDPVILNLLKIGDIPTRRSDLLEKDTVVFQNRHRRFLGKAKLTQNDFSVPKGCSQVVLGYLSTEALLGQ